MREKPSELQVYRHFKGNLYQVVTVAVHTETGEELVIYRPLYKEGRIFARPLEMFLSEVDHSKYPNAEQKYRFELLNGQQEEPVFENVQEVITKVEIPQETTTESEVQQETEAVLETQESTTVCEETNGASKDELPNIEADSADLADENEDEGPAQLDPLLERFLDAGSYEEKLNVFYLMKRKGTKDMLSYVAMSLDIQLSKEDFDEQYAEILSCLKTMEKFECNRLRP